jgi:hypothetical protein
MVSGCTKKVVVIRNIPSNIIEEAILILRSGPDDKNVNGEKVPERGRRQNNDHLLKEAEIIINNYIKENKLHVETKRRGFKNSFLRDSFLSNIYFNLALAGGILFLIILVIKALV